jgi:hypothetical protein
VEIDLEKLNPGTWFDLPGGGRISLRVCAGDDYRAITDQVVRRKSEVVFDPKSGRAHRLVSEETDERKLTELLWDFCIVDWEGIVDASGKPIPCTAEMKLRLMGRSPAFFSMVSERLDRLRALEKEEAEALEKN